MPRPGAEVAPEGYLARRAFRTGDPLWDDFRNFLYHAFRILRGSDPTGAQYQAAEFLQHGPQYRMVGALRGFGKSLIAYLYGLYELERDFLRTGGRPSLNLMIVSGTKDLADNAAYFLREAMQSIPELRNLIPHADGRWASTSFDVAGAIPQPSPSVFSRGVLGRMTGDRADLIVFDDIEIPANAETPGQRDKLHRRALEFLDLLKKGGEVVGLGTPQVEDTVYERMEAWGFEIRYWPAEYPTPSWMARNGARLAPELRAALEADPSLTGTPIEPIRHPEEELAKRRTASRSRYALQFLLDSRPSDEERYPLKLADLIVAECDSRRGPVAPQWTGAPSAVRNDLPNVGLPGDLLHGPVPGVETPWVPFEQVVCAIDPAGRGKDETAWSVLGAIGGNLYLLRSHGMQGGYGEEVLDRIADDVERYGAQVVPYEENFGQGMFGNILGRRLQERGIRAQLEPVTARSQKEHRIVDALEPVMNQHRLVVDPRVVLEDRPGRGEQGQLYRLFYQMTRLAKVKGALVFDDRVDSLALGVGYLNARMLLTQTDVLRERKRLAEEAGWDRYWAGEVGGPGPRARTWATSRAWSRPAGR